MKSRRTDRNQGAGTETNRAQKRTGLKRIAAAALVSVLILGASFYFGVNLIDDPLAGRQPGREQSTRFEDRQGRPLREFLSGRETRSEWLGLEAMSIHLTTAAIAAEDRRFFFHHGVDPLAVLRAAWLNLKHRRIVSGASTITMQLARSLDPGPRTWRQKINEALRALRMERSHTKAEILEQYLNRIPCGNLVQGVPAAVRLYLDKSPENLSPAEAAFIMALPQAPSTLNPYHGQGPVLARRNRILKRMAALGFLDQEEAKRAAAEPLNLIPPRRHFRAPHFVTALKARLPRPIPPVVKTTLDLELQSRLEDLTAQAVERVKSKGISQAAVLVMDHRTREILAWVGSVDFFDPVEGQNDGVIAARQPGSAVKPLTYATAFDAGFSPADIIDDSPVSFGLKQGVYSPRNYDERYHGPVSLRTALASSLNVPAVKLLNKVGLNPVYEKMKAAGLTSLEHEPDFYGLGLTLGAGDISLLELASAYATLASGGVYRDPVMIRSDQTRGKSRRVFSPQAAYLITDILGDDTARAIGFGHDSLLNLPFPSAAKTGTSKNFRDNWTVGYTSDVVVAVWAGNFDARPMGRVSGITGAGPLWRQVMRLCAEYYPPRPFTRPKGLVEVDICPETGLRAAPDCPRRKRELFMTENVPAGFCAVHHHRTATPDPARDRTGLVIVNPRSGERYLFDPGIEAGFQNISLEAEVPPEVDCLIWKVNGIEAARIRTDEGQPRPFYYPLTRGTMNIELLGQARGRIVASDQVSITVH